MTDAHLTIVQDRKTGLYHGAVLRPHSLPSGAERWRLSVTLNTGHATQSAAAEAANAALPHMAPIDPKTLDSDEDSDVVNHGLPIGAVVTAITPQFGKRREHGVPETEVRFDGVLLPIVLSERRLRRLIVAGRIEMDSSSGSDPSLHYRYDHYVVV